MTKVKRALVTLRSDLASCPDLTPSAVHDEPQALCRSQRNQLGISTLALYYSPPQPSPDNTDTLGIMFNSALS